MCVCVYHIILFNCVLVDLQEFTKHTIASPLEITLPNESNMSSFAYSITEVCSLL